MKVDECGSKTGSLRNEWRSKTGSMGSLVITWPADLIFMTAIRHFDGNHLGQKARCTIEPSWIALFSLVKIFPW